LGGRDPSGGGARIKSIPHITGVDVLHSTATVREGKTVEYHVDLKVGYVVEPGWIDLYMQTT